MYEMKNRNVILSAQREGSADLKQILRSLRSLRMACLLFIGLILLPLSAEAIVYLKPKEALKQLFAGSDVVKAEKKTLTAADREKLRQTLGYAVTGDTVTFFVGYSGDKIDGYVLMDQQIGKTQPITFMTLIGTDGVVREIEVLAYQESQGSQIRYPRFREQFRGKDSSAPLQVGQDIQNITGATLSVRATTETVRRALALWNLFYGLSSKP